MSSSREGNVECEMFVTGPTGHGRLSANQPPDRSVAEVFRPGELRLHPLCARPIEVEGGERLTLKFSGCWFSASTGDQAPYARLYGLFKLGVARHDKNLTLLY